METEGGWCILRTTGGRTLRLASSLRDVGIEAWTPSHIQKRRRPRTGVKVDREVAMVPTFVFAPSSRLTELLDLAMLRISAHPAFSLFRFGGRIPVIADQDIADLRAAEERAKRNVLKRYRFDAKKGSIVRPKDGPWAGLEGVIEETAGNYALVCFNGLRVKVAYWLLDPNEIKAA